MLFAEANDIANFVSILLTQLAVAVNYKRSLRSRSLRSLSVEMTKQCSATGDPSTSLRMTRFTQQCFALGDFSIPLRYSQIVMLCIYNVMSPSRSLENTQCLERRDLNYINNVNYKRSFDFAQDDTLELSCRLER